MLQNYHWPFKKGFSSCGLLTENSQVYCKTSYPLTQLSHHGTELDYRFINSDFCMSSIWLGRQMHSLDSMAKYISGFNLPMYLVTWRKSGLRKNNGPPFVDRVLHVSIGIVFIPLKHIPQTKFLLLPVWLFMRFIPMDKTPLDSWSNKRLSSLRRQANAILGLSSFG